MRVLFVVKEFLPKPTPPGICIMNVQKALLEKGVQSDVLMVGEDEGLYRSSEMGEIYSIKSEISFETGKEGIFGYLKTRIPMIFTWPVPSMKRVQDYRRVITKLNESKQYDAIIGTMFPPDVCVACSVFDHFFYYELDSLINNPIYKEGFKRHFTGRLSRLEKKLFDHAELIIHLNHNKYFYAKEKYRIYADKFVYTDIPNLTIKKDAHNGIAEYGKVLSNITEDTIVMVYSGHLSKDYRSPYRLIQMLKAISKNLDLKCLFFSRGNCEDELRKAEEETGGAIQRMGYVSQNELEHYVDRADFLLDIGNRLSGDDYSVPSKVICYMATGKPIIHMNGTNDSAIDYLDKYGLSIHVSDELSIDTAQQLVMQFIKKNKKRRIPFSEVAEKFPQNTPEHTADIIINQIKKRSNQ